MLPAAHEPGNTARRARAHGEPWARVIDREIAFLICGSCLPGQAAAGPGHAVPGGTAALNGIVEPRDIAEPPGTVVPHGTAELNDTAAAGNQLPDPPSG